MNSARSRFADVAGIRTHYLEGGSGPALVLLHGGEFGACAEFTWEFNFDALAEHFHVIAPDWLGFGKTEKLFSFEGMWDKRVDHIAALLRTIGVERADFMGNSMGGTVLIAVASRNDGRWPIDRMVLVSGGGFVPENEARAVLTSYDGTEGHMRRIVEVLFRNPAVLDDADYVPRRQAMAMLPGAWECTAAPRFRAPGRPPQPLVERVPNYATIAAPTFIVAGRFDNLREAGYAEQLQRDIAGSELLLLDAGHCPQIDLPEAFNRAVIEYLCRPRTL